LTSRVASQRRRDRYIIDYSKSRSGCDSAVKYPLATLQDINTPQLVSRPNEPDFSDLFILSEEDYEELLAERAAENAFDTDKGLRGITDVNDANEINDFNDISGIAGFNEPNSLTIRGPYGPPWPFVTEPVEFEIGSATVKIEIEDENAKYPAVWAMLGDEEVRREALAGFETFCEWMGIEHTQIDSLREQLDEVSKIKPFKLDLKPITIRTRTSTTTAKQTTGRTSIRRGRRITRPRYTTTRLPTSAHTTDFAKLFHSSLIDIELLARPTIISESRKESALKYMGMWGSKEVNINTAPRQVLEAAFTFGGDADEIAEEIIQRRRIKPFKDIDELRQELLRYSDSIGKCESYITTVSKFFTIKVTATSGVAKASAIIAIMKDGRKLERIAVISG